MASDLSEISDKSEYPISFFILLTFRRYRKSEEFWQNSSDNYLTNFSLADAPNASNSTIFTAIRKKLHHKIITTTANDKELSQRIIREVHPQNTETAELVGESGG